ncbi:MAG: methyltransferase domain-containing protein [Deltaproteobacteria bacterium]|nr:methyltransferase domain-containing protein [Deltaproteobacteria bacterium]
MGKRRKKDQNIDGLHEHYLIEKELAVRLWNATKEERRSLYKSIYNELFQRVPSIAVPDRKHLSTSRATLRQIRMLKPFLNEGIRFLEIGPGSCALSFEVSKHVREVYAVDVSEEIVNAHSCPENFHLILYNGVDIPVPDNSVDIVYSHHLMEHLHPEDARDQLQDIYKKLTPGGLYICITPNRIFGPSDISRYFDETTTGLHLKEYTHTEVLEMMKEAGFSEVVALVGTKNMRLRTRCPVVLLQAVEAVFLSLPGTLSKRIATNRKMKRLLTVKLIARK